MDNLIKELIDGLPDEVMEALLRKVAPERFEQAEQMRQLIMDMAVITCIVNHCEDINPAVRHCFDLAPDWLLENHHCEEGSDHIKFLAKMVLWAREQTEIHLGLRNPNGSLITGEEQ